MAHNKESIAAFLTEHNSTDLLYHSRPPNKLKTDGYTFFKFRDQYFPVKIANRKYNFKDRHPVITFYKETINIRSDEIWYNGGTKNPHFGFKRMCVQHTKDKTQNALYKAAMIYFNSTLDIPHGLSQILTRVFGHRTYANFKYHKSGRRYILFMMGVSDDPTINIFFQFGQAWTSVIPLLDKDFTDKTTWVPAGNLAALKHKFITFAYKSGACLLDEYMIPYYPTEDQEAIRRYLPRNVKISFKRPCMVADTGYTRAQTNLGTILFVDNGFTVRRIVLARRVLSGDELRQAIDAVRTEISILSRSTIMGRSNEEDDDHTSHRRRGRGVYDEEEGERELDATTLAEIRAEEAAQRQDHEDNKIEHYDDDIDPDENDRDEAINGRNEAERAEIELQDKIDAEEDEEYYEQERKDAIDAKALADEEIAIAASSKYGLDFHVDMTVDGRDPNETYETEEDDDDEYDMDEPDFKGNLGSDDRVLARDYRDAPRATVAPRIVMNSQSKPTAVKR